MTDRKPNLFDYTRRKEMAVLRGLDGQWVDCLNERELAIFDQACRREEAYRSYEYPSCPVTLEDGRDLSSQTQYEIRESLARVRLIEGHGDDRR